MDTIRFDGVLIVGAGLAGLSAALAAAPRPVMVMSAGALGADCASVRAQGGMAAALSPGDSPAAHAADTLAAGAGLAEAEAVELLVREAPNAVRRLAALGAPFDRDGEGFFRQGLEAAHSYPRIARVGGDGAGQAIMAAVVAAVRGEARITVREGWRLAGLVTDASGRVRGVTARAPEGPIRVLADAVILATGGVGGLYAVTTNPASALGEGLAAAALAGAEILDPEFVQFHPTALAVPADPAPLATEALRGEGARLVDATGRRFMGDYHPDAELAPRDVVARAIESERIAGRGAFLDGRAEPGVAFPQAFPAVFAACRAAGLDPRTAPIPVRPAAHYHMGGIATDAEGRTSLEGLFAIGECAATGVHGANRLASNSLVEAAVWGARAGVAASALNSESGPVQRSALAPALPGPPLQRLRRRMSNQAGVVRSGRGLADLAGWLAETEAVHGPALPLIAARLIAAAALERRESRGAHFRADHPHSQAVAAHTRLAGPAWRLRADEAA